MNIKLNFWKYIIVQQFLFLHTVSAPAGEYGREDFLTLHEAEQLALESDPIVIRFQAQETALSELAIAEGQLPDPQLSFGIAEVPLDDFDLGEHEDTELRLGLSQKFPPGNTLKFRTERMQAMASAEQARLLNRRLEILRDVRNAYVELHYQLEAHRILTVNRDLFSEMEEITERQYAQGRDIQHDVLRAQLELSLIEDRIEESRGSIQIARAELSKWVSNNNAYRPLPETEPDLPVPDPQVQLVDALSQHPLLAVEDAYIKAAKKTVAIVGEQYKPEWMIDFMVSENTGSSFDQRTGPDFSGVFLNMSLPIFTDKRQDKRMSASKQEEVAARYGRADQLREMVRQAQVEYANLERLNQRLELYQKRATLEAEQTKEAAFNAYQSDLADFETLVRARVLALETDLKTLLLKSERLKSRINLLYLGGDPQW
jgi:outer membrane protein TolC